MNTIPVSQAFGFAPPGSRCVLCLRGAQGGTDLVLTEWFTWLNIKRNPMLSFSLPRKGMGTELRTGDAFVLAFPRAELALKYEKGLSAAADGAGRALPGGVIPVAAADLPVLVPGESVVALRCTLAGAYNYPFKKVRIFNCNLEEAYGDPARMQAPRQTE